MAAPRSEPATLTIPEAAKMLRICRGVAYRLAREGKLPGSLRLGHRWLVSRVALEAYLQGQHKD